MAGGNTITLTFLGEDAPLRRTLSGLDSAIGGVGKGIATMAGLGAAASLAASSIAAVPLAIGGLGIAAVAQNEQVKGAFTGLAEHVKAKTGELAAPFVPVLTRIADDTRKTFDQVAPQLGQMFSAAAPQVYALSEGVRGFVVNAMPGMQTALEAAAPVTEALADGISMLGSGLSGFLRGLSAGADGAAAGLEGIFTVVGGLLPVVGQLIGTLAGSLGPVFAAVAPLIVALAQTVREILTPIITALGPPITAVVQALSAALMPVLVIISQSFAQMAPMIGMIAEQFGALLVQAIELLAPLLPPLVEAFFAILNALMPILPPIMQLASELLPVFAEILTVAAGVITNVIVPAIQGLAGWFTGLVETAIGLVRGIKEAWDRIPQFVADGVRGVQDWLGRVEQWFRDLPGNILRAVGDLGRLLINAGGDILRGLWDGIVGMGTWLRDKIGGFFGSLLPGWAKDFLGISSPSKVFRDQVGVHIPTGVAAGIEDSTPNLIRSAQAMTDAVRDAAVGGLDGWSPLTVDDGGRSAALAELLDASRSGTRIGEDMSFGDMSANLGRWNDDLARDFYQANRGFDWGRGGEAAALQAWAAGQAGSPPAPAAGPREVRFTGNTDSAFASAFMALVRTGKIQIGV